MTYILLTYANGMGGYYNFTYSLFSPLGLLSTIVVITYGGASVPSGFFFLIIFLIIFFLTTFFFETSAPISSRSDAPPSFSISDLEFDLEIYWLIG